MDGRIIPARAGQTISAALMDGATTDHPRACGANVNPWTSSESMVGSSPRVRGKLLGTPLPYG